MFYADKNGIFAPYLNAKALYLESNNTSFVILSNNTTFCEAVFTEAEGTYLYIKANGQFETDERAENYKGFPIIQRIHNGICNYLLEYYSYKENTRLQIPDKDYSAKLIESIGFVRLNNKIEEACCFEDSFRGSANRHSSVFE
jgi:protein associated with RNAse G/E